MRNKSPFWDTSAGFELRHEKHCTVVNIHPENIVLRFSPDFVSNV